MPVKRHPSGSRLFSWVAVLLDSVFRAGNPRGPALDLGFSERYTVRAMRVLIVPDKFKGTLSAGRVAEALAAGWERRRPQDSLDLLPMSDGGDGFGEVIGRLVGAIARTRSTVDAAHRPCRSRWWWASGSSTAVIETAESNGLARLPRKQFHPFELDTFGVGRLIEAARTAGAREVLLGVGGSATNDGGFGLARALGWEFLDRQKNRLERWTDLPRLDRLVPPPSESGRSPRFVVATDVSNPLLGPKGATRVYGPQKGLVGEDLRVAEEALGQLARVVKSQLGFDSEAPGCGAAGGLGFGLQVFLGAERRLGFDLFAELARLERRVRQADLVITAEGSMDASSLMGKGVGQILDLCERLGRRVIAVAGRVELPEGRPEHLVAAESLVQWMGEAEAMARPGAGLRKVAAHLASNLRFGG